MLQRKMSHISGPPFCMNSGMRLFYNLEGQMQTAREDPRTQKVDRDLRARWRILRAFGAKFFGIALGDRDPPVLHISQLLINTVASARWLRLRAGSAASAAFDSAGGSR